MKHARPGPWCIAAILIVAVARGTAQEAAGTTSRPIVAAPSQPLVDLGAELFKDARLSGNRTMSCTSCHRPELAFTDGRRHAIGQDGASLGRNTPTLYGVGSSAAFPVGGSMGVLAENLDLHRRVLAPLANEAEMNASVDHAILHLKNDKTLESRFDAAFAEADPSCAGDGATPWRLGTALAAYVRSLAPPPSRGMLALGGQDVPSSDSERRGLGLFRGSGRCTTCHAGPALTDGRSYVVATFRRQRGISPPADDVADERPSSRPDAIVVAGGSVVIAVPPDSGANEARIIEVEFLPSGGTRRYGHRDGFGHATFDPIERQTCSLIDVGRTGPYFRDGSAARLDEAVRRHVADLREIGRERAAIAANPDRLLAGVSLRVSPTPSVVLSDAGRQQLASDAWVPDRLDATQLEDLVAFLRSLSPER
jgi:cytochrome c peroxidase